MWLKDIELKHVWDIIEKMQPSDIVTIKDIAPNRPKEFIEACKMYIDCLHDLEFNSDYSRMKRVKQINDLIDG